MSTRFSNNPVQSPVVNTSRIAATDTATGNDVALTPQGLTEYAQANMSLANGSSNGLMSGEQATKLDALRTSSEEDAINTQLAQLCIPVFIGSPVDGEVLLMRSVYDNDVELDFALFSLSSGTGQLTVIIDGTPVTGMTDIPLSSTPGSATATAAKTLAPEQVLGIQFNNGSGMANLYFTLRGDLQLT